MGVVVLADAVHLGMLVLVGMGVAQLSDMVHLEMTVPQWVSCCQKKTATGTVDTHVLLTFGYLLS